MKRSVTPLLFSSVAVLAALLAFVLCFAARDAEPVLLTDVGDGSETAAAFFDALCSGDYAAARELCPALPADAPPQDGDAAALHALLCSERSWESGGDFTRRGTSSEGTVRFTYLDLRALTADMKSDVNALLERYVEEAARRDEIYADDGGYRDEVVQRAWDEAYAGRLSRAEDYRVTEELRLELRYREQRWEIQGSDELLRCLRGGV